jgi:hypothetical protein
MRVFRRIINYGLASALLAQAFVYAQATVVPFVGCESDGQSGHRAAPKEKGRPFTMSARDLQELAYYRSAQGIGTLAPRGWYCFGTYGSGGEDLFLSPIDNVSYSTGGGSLAGPAIEISHRNGFGSGAYEVAKVIARIFPAFREYAVSTQDVLGPLQFGPYPKDRLTYLSQSAVEYETVAQSDGLGTQLRLRKNSSAIYRVAMLVGQPPDLVRVAVRLPRQQSRLTSAIVRQVEKDAGHRSN